MVLGKELNLVSNVECSTVTEWLQKTGQATFDGKYIQCLVI